MPRRPVIPGAARFPMGAPAGGTPPGRRPAPPTLGASTSSGASERAELGGPAADWGTVATGRPGYVVSGDYWTEPAGHDQATFTLSSLYRSTSKCGTPPVTRIWLVEASRPVPRRPVAAPRRYA